MDKVDNIINKKPIKFCKILTVKQKKLKRILPEESLILTKCVIKLNDKCQTELQTNNNFQYIKNCHHTISEVLLSVLKHYNKVARL
jgi:hypothetical protein